MSFPTIEPLGDEALLLRWGDSVDTATNLRVHAFAARVRAASVPWLRDCVPAYASLAIFFDGATPTRVHDWLLALLRDAGADEEANVEAARIVDVPVCYGGDFGPDLDDVAKACGLSAAQVIERHAQPAYLVAMLGFSPGFPYLLGLDPTLAVPRLATPRVRVPEGSVGIGGAQTGVYPDAGPGGWRLIGRTPLRLFDTRREPPARLAPGDRLRFVPIDAARFHTLAEGDA